MGLIQHCFGAPMTHYPPPTEGATGNPSILASWTAQEVQGLPMKWTRDGGTAERGWRRWRHGWLKPVQHLAVQAEMFLKTALRADLTRDRTCYCSSILRLISAPSGMALASQTYSKSLHSAELQMYCTDSGFVSNKQRQTSVWFFT